MLGPVPAGWLICWGGAPEKLTKGADAGSIRPMRSDPMRGRRRVDSGQAHGGCREPRLGVTSVELAARARCPKTNCRARGSNEARYSMVQRGQTYNSVVMRGSTTQGAKGFVTELTAQPARGVNRMDAGDEQGWANFKGRDSTAA